MFSKPVNIAPWLDAKRLEEEIACTILPKPRKEPWKYTSLKRVLERLDRPFNSTDTLPTVLGAGVLVGLFSQPNIASLAGQYVNQIATSANNVLATLNLLRAQRGYAIVSADDSSAATPVVNIPSSNSCERILIVVQENTNLEVVEYTTGGNRIIECLVHPGARLIHRRLQPETSEIEYNALTVNVKERSSYRLEQYSVGAKLRRNDIVVDIEGAGANVEISGGWRLANSSHIDTQVSVNHLAKSATSHQKFHGIVGDSARAIFGGRIYIGRNASRTDAHLQNKNIAINDGASIFTKPELEIYTDDVACSHGATSGQLDEKQIFYLQSRGIPDEKARELILGGFLSEIVAHEDGARVLGIEPNESNL